MADAGRRLRGESIEPRAGRPRRSHVAYAVLVLAYVVVVHVALPTKADAATLGCSGDRPAGVVDLPTWNADILEHTNAHRATLGLQPLQLDVGLARGAQWKARDLAARGYFEHSDPASGDAPARDPWSRLTECGYTSMGGRSENIHGGRHLADPAQVVREWIASPGHRANIENAAYRYMGVGSARNPLRPYRDAQQREWYYVQMFAVHSSPAGLGEFPVRAPVASPATTVTAGATDPAVVHAAPDTSDTPWLASALVVLSHTGAAGMVRLTQDDRAVSFLPAAGATGRATITVDTINLVGQRSGQPVELHVGVEPARTPQEADPGGAVPGGTAPEGADPSVPIRELTAITSGSARLVRTRCRSPHAVKVGMARWCLKVRATGLLRGVDGGPVARVRVALRSMGMGAPMTSTMSSSSGTVHATGSLIVPRAHRGSMAAAVRWVRRQHRFVTWTFVGTSTLAPATSAPLRVM